jgi:localization factor PodJL
MKFGVPWSVKGIRPEARDTAIEAARRSGVSLGEWLNAVIIQQAEQEGVQPHADDGAESYYDDIATVNERLDALTRRIEQLTRGGPEAYAPKRSRNDSDQLAELIGRLDRRLDQFANATPPAPPPAMPHVQLPPSLDRAVAEITARQRTLNGHTAPSPQRPPSAAAAPLPAQDLSGLEDQLRRITDQIETLRKPGVEQAINALREELREIGRALSDAMPRRALDAIEKQIQVLNQRIAEGRQAGIDAAALGGIEHGLTEVRDALRGLTPAESLVGFHDAIIDLTHKIDFIVAQKDPATLAQLESAITTLREIATHIASNEAVAGLATQVQTLAEKVESVASARAGADTLRQIEQRIAALSDALASRTPQGDAAPSRVETLVMSLADRIEQIQNSRGNDDAFLHLEQRIAALADALADRSQRGDAVPTRLEALVQALADKIEHIQDLPGNGDAFRQLEDHIVHLAERLDASDARFGHLEAIERGLTDLLVHVEDLRSGKDTGESRAQDAPAVDGLKHDIARTQDALEAVHGTLGDVVSRLTMIEKDIRGAGQPPASAVHVAALDQPAGAIALRAFDRSAAALAPATLPETAAPPLAPPPAAARRLPAAAHQPIEADLAPDQPLEPGSGPPPGSANPAARIAASEAALGDAGAAATGSKSNFIAAARRAAQAALQETSAQAPRPQVRESRGPDSPSLRSKMMKRVKSLFVAASIIAIVVGAIQIAGNVRDHSKSASKTAESRAPDAGKTSATKTDGAESPDAGIATTPPAPANEVVAPAPSDNAKTATNPPQSLNQITPATPSLFGPPTLDPNADITGSISRQPSRDQAAAPAEASPQSVVPLPNQLPAAIGGPRLRSAAIAGDGAAAYEVAMRYAEGRGVPANMEEAARWYERAAVKGVTPAQFRYATLLEKGLGVKKDLVRARELYRAAASKGNSKAMHNLAVLYAEGVDGKPDYAAAVQWFRKAAQRGIADSQYNLGVLCARGIGAAQNYGEAYKWFALAAAQGDKEAAKKRDDVASQLDATALAAAKHAVASFVAEPQPAAATAVPAPAGGWDHATGALPARAKARPAQLQTFGTFQIGNR